jgi:chitinase
MFAQSQYRVIGYYTSWGQSTLPVSSVKFNSLTHINYAFAEPNPNGSISGTADAALINAAHLAGCKILISLGGANSGSAFTAVTADSIKRKTFINNLAAYLTKNNYDGADIDWEGVGSSADSINIHVFIKQIHESFLQTNPSFLLTMAIGSSSYEGQWLDYPTLSKYVDWFNVMTYDMDQGWSGNSGYNAALYYDYIGQDYSVDQSIFYLTGGHSPLLQKSKLVLGVPFYGKYFYGSPSFNTKFTSRTTPSYSNINTLFQSGGWTRYWDSTAQVPYLKNESSVITYDDSLSIAFKCQYAKAKGLAGIMIWELSQDVIGKTQPLLDAIAKEMLTPNNIVEQPLESRITNFILYDNYPNPFNPSTTIKFSLPRATQVSIRVYDVLGREIATLMDEFKFSGIGSVQFDASRYRLSSGVYFYRMTAGSFTETKRLLLVK